MIPLKPIFFDETESLFEGTVIDQTTYFDINSTRFIAYKIQIHKVFKGEIQLGTIEVFTDQINFNSDHSIPALMNGETYTIDSRSSDSEPSHFPVNNKCRCRFNYRFEYHLKYDQVSIDQNGEKNYSYKQYVTKDSSTVTGPFYDSKPFTTTEDFYEFLHCIPGISLKSTDGKTFIRQTSIDSRK